MNKYFTSLILISLTAFAAVVTEFNGTSIQSAYTIQVNPGVLTTTTDGAVYYFGAFASYTPDANQGRQRLTVPKSGTIRAIVLDSYASTAGTAENWTMEYKVNNGSPVTIATVGAATTVRLWANYALSTAVTQGDYIEIFTTSPTWATEPGSFRLAGRIYIE